MKEVVEEGRRDVIARLHEHEAVSTKLGDGAPGEMEALLEQQSRLQEQIEAANGWALETELEFALEQFAGGCVSLSHDRWFLDRLATPLLAFQGDSKAVWFEGHYTDYEADRKKRLGKDAERLHRTRSRGLTRN